MWRWKREKILSCNVNPISLFCIILEKKTSGPPEIFYLIFRKDLNQHKNEFGEYLKVFLIHLCSFQYTLNMFPLTFTILHNIPTSKSYLTLAQSLSHNNALT